MGNVVDFGATRGEIKTEEVKSGGDNFVSEYLIPWAIENGVDVHSQKFRVNGATILTCIQGMLLNDI